MILTLIAALAATPDPACTTIADAVAEAEQNGGEMIDLVDVPGKHFDQLLIVQANGIIQMAEARKGCIIAISALDPAVEKGTPA